MNTPQFEIPEDSPDAIRRELIDYFDGPDFDHYMADIHLSSTTAKISTVVGMISKTAREMKKNRGVITKELEQRYRSAAASAPVLLSHIVMANTMVLYSGQSSPALVVVAFGEGADEAMMKACSVLARIHFEDSENEQEAALAKEITDETYRFGKRRRLPEWLVGNVEAYAADLWVPGIAAHEEGLLSEILVVLAEPGINGLTAAVPKTVIDKALGTEPTPPPIPSNKQHLHRFL